MKINIQNIKIKQEYYKWLKEVKGKNPATIDKIECSLSKFEEFLKYEDFTKFNKEKALSYKSWLKKSKYRNKPMQISTYCHYLKMLKNFYEWLIMQPGYKSKLSGNDIAYLNTADSESKISQQGRLKKNPSLEYAIKLTASIKGKSEIEMRDRALIAFTVLTGMRDSAMASLPLGCVEIEEQEVYQDPKAGVKTKYSKQIMSKIFSFDKRLLNFVLEWTKYLNSKGFTCNDPLFPRAKTASKGKDLSFQKSDEVEPIYWQGAGRIRYIFKNRAKAANMEYYNPHLFRRLTAHLAIEKCRNGEEMAAVSQHFGHEHVATTIGSYVNFDTFRLSQILKRIDSRNGRPKNKSN